MPSHRTIDPAFWHSENVAGLSIARRYFLIAILSNADDQGRLRAHPAVLRSQLYPFDDISLDEIQEALAELAEGSFITLYSAGGKDYLQISNWWTHQPPRWARPSDHPPPEGWTDRVRYRQGNAVIKENWNGSEETAGSDPNEDEPAEGSIPEEPEVLADASTDQSAIPVEPSWGRGVPTVAQSRDHGGAKVGSAPSNRDRGRDKDRGRNRGRESGSNRGSSSGRGGPAVGGPRPPPKAAAGPKRNTLALHAILAARGAGGLRPTELVTAIWSRTNWSRPGGESRKHERGQKCRKDSGLHRSLWTRQEACGILRSTDPRPHSGSRVCYVTIRSRPEP